MKKQKRPPRQVWLVWSALGDDNGLGAGAFRRKCDAVEWVLTCGDDVSDHFVAGPYVLAERVRQK